MAYLGRDIGTKLVRIRTTKELADYLFQFRESAQDMNLVGGEYLQSYLKVEGKATRAKNVREQRLDELEEAKAKRARGLIDKKDLERFQVRLDHAEVKLRNRQGDLKMLITHVMPLEVQRRWAYHRAKERLLEQAAREAENTREQLRATKYSLRAAFRAEEDKLATMTELIDACRVHAPRDGIVLHADLARGDAVKPGQLLLRVADPDRLQVRVQVPEDKFALLKGEVRRETGYSETLRCAMLMGLSGLHLLATDAAFAELRQPFRALDSQVGRSFIRVRPSGFGSWPFPARSIRDALPKSPMPQSRFAPAEGPRPSSRSRSPWTPQAASCAPA